MNKYFEELKRRKVVRVCIAYIVGAWVLLQIDKALDCLEKSVRKGMTEVDWIINDSDLDNLRDHPRFKALLESS